jgi:hypothetical protein
VETIYTVQSQMVCIGRSGTKKRPNRRPSFDIRNREIFQFVRLDTVWGIQVLKDLGQLSVFALKKASAIPS